MYIYRATVTVRYVLFASPVVMFFLLYYCHATYVKYNPKYHNVYPLVSSPEAKWLCVMIPIAVFVMSIVVHVFVLRWVLTKVFQYSPRGCDT